MLTTLHRNRRLSTTLPKLITRLFSTRPELNPTRIHDPLYRKLSALGRSSESKVTETINTHIAEGGTVDKSRLISCARELRRYKRHAHALQIIDWMSEQTESGEFKFGFKEHSLRMELINKVKGINAVESYFNGLDSFSKNRCTYGMLLYCYCEDNCIDKALDVFKVMDGLGMLDLALPFSNVMSLYMRIGEFDKVGGLFEEMKRRGVKPSVFAYNLLMNSYSRLDNVEGVERVFAEMGREDKRAFRDWKTYSNLAILYLRVGNVGKAEAALKRLEDEMGSGNRDGYHFLISLYAKVGDRQKVYRVWKCLKMNVKQVTNMSYLIMLQALRNLKDVIGMKKCYEEWESVHLCFDVRLANTVIGAYLKLGKVEEAEAVFGRAVEKSEGPFFEACEYFMAYYLKEGGIKEALQYLEIAVSKNGDQKWHPKKDVINGFPKYLNGDYDVSHAEKFCSLVKKIDCVDVKLYKPLLQKVLKVEAVVEDFGQCLLK